MGKNLYVGNLPFSMTEERLAEVFKEAGAVRSAKIIFDKQTGKSRGFGFVEMEADDAAHTAIEKFSGANIDGRAIVVNEARPKEEKHSGGGHRRY